MTRRNRLLAVVFVPAALALVWLVLSLISPWRQPGPVIRLQVGPDWERSAMFDSRALTCPLAEDDGANSSKLRAECSLEIAGKPLAFALEHDGNNTIGRCEATYAGAPVRCQSAIAFYNSQLPSVHIESDLGLGLESLRGLPGTNPLFYVSEGAWFWVGNVAAALIVATALWLFGRGAPAAPRTAGQAAGRAALYLFNGGILFAFVWFAMLFVTLTTGLVD